MSQFVVEAALRRHLARQTRRFIIKLRHYQDLKPLENCVDSDITERTASMDSVPLGWKRKGGSGVTVSAGLGSPRADRALGKWLFDGVSCPPIDDLYRDVLLRGTYCGGSGGQANVPILA